MAFPDGAPWGAANPDATENCAGCHFDGEPFRDSKALTVTGLPETLAPDTIYEIMVQFENPGGMAAGFQMFAAADSQSPGSFTSDADNTETVGAAIRSTAPVEKEGPVCWTVRWRTPKAIESAIKIYVAASAANFDRSAFGDNIHFRSYRFDHKDGL
jgi:hypothetical protein